MPLSLAEEVVEVYFQKKGYFVIRNLTYPKKLRGKQPGNLDIDVLATNGAEVIIVSCKRGSLSSKQEEEEIEKFNKHEEFLRNEEKYRDFVKNLRIQKWYVAEYVSAHNRNTLQPEIKVKLLKEILDELIEMLKKEMGLNMLVGAETKVLPRLLKFMIENKLIEEEKDK